MIKNIFGIFFLLCSTCLGIIGGAVAPQGKFPSTTLVLNSGCTGSRISAHLLASARHCDLGFKVGEPLRLQWNQKIDFKLTKGAPKTAEPIVKKIHYAPDDDDLMIFEIAEAIDLPATAMDFTPLRPNTFVMMSGYGCVHPDGMTTYKPEYFPFLQKFSEKHVRSVDEKYIDLPAVDADGKGESVGCRDDSGGPLYRFAADKSLRIVGIAISAGSEGTSYLRLDADTATGRWLKDLVETTEK